MKKHVSITPNSSFGIAGVVLFVIVVAWSSVAYDRYKDNNKTSGSNCSECHGDFTGTNSPKGTVFPSASKHEMHRASTSMNTACALCHTSSDNRNPYTWTSDGTGNNTGLGCSGCHEGPGLRRHHEVNGITFCYDCHDPNEVPSPENVKPPYYGTPDTRADNPGNTVLAANTNENWSVGDFIGLDNDGNGLYDLADFAIGPYRIQSVKVEGNNVRITWLTAGGRRDAVQASGLVRGPYATVSPAVTIPGVGLVTTNYVEVGAATNTMRFYRLKYTP